jgi:membrane-associated phospholipid phosphatase
VTAGACLLGLVVLYLLAVRTGFGQHLDDDALLGRSVNPRVQHAASRLLRSIDVASLVALGGGIVLLAVARARVRLALGAAALIVGATGTAEGLKHVLARPELTGPDRLPIPSFPSGHTTVATSLVLGLVIVLPSRWRALAAVLGVVYAAAVGVATVTAAWHRPSDVVGGFLLTVAWAAVVCAALEAWAPPAPPRAARAARRSVRVAVGLLALATVLLGGFGLAAARTIESFNDRNLRTLPVGASYVGSVAAMAAAGAALIGVFVGALDGAVLDPGPRPARGKVPPSRPKLMVKD